MKISRSQFVDSAQQNLNADLERTSATKIIHNRRRGTTVNELRSLRSSEMTISTEKETHKKRNCSHCVRKPRSNL